MPGLNPFYWLLCGFIFIASILVAVFAGFGAFATTYFFLSRRRAVVFFASSVGLLTAILACAFTFGGLISWTSRNHSIPATQPTINQLTGTWTLSAISLNRMRSQGGYKISTHTLTLREDGTFDLINMPDWWLNDFGDSRRGFYSGSGTWEVGKDSQGYWIIELQFNSLSGPISNRQPSFFIGQEKSIYYLYAVIGDPDTGNVIAFERSHEKSE